MIDIQGDVFFSLFVLVSGLMQCLLDAILVCVTREKVKKMQNKRQKPITGSGRAVSAGPFITN